MVDKRPCETLAVLVALGLHHCVRVLSCSSFPHVTAVVRVIYGCQEVPRSTQRPPKNLTGGGGHGHKILMYFFCQRVTGRSLPKPCCSLGNNGITKLVGPPSSRPEPRTNVFHLFLLAEGVCVRVRVCQEWEGALPPSPLGSLLLLRR